MVPRADLDIKRTAVMVAMSDTWTGRGRKPNWLVDAVKKGAKLDSFKI